jgi:hypothetical protein
MLVDILKFFLFCLDVPFAAFQLLSLSYGIFYGIIMELSILLILLCSSFPPFVCHRILDRDDLRQLARHYRNTRMRCAAASVSRGEMPAMERMLLSGAAHNHVPAFGRGRTNAGWSAATGGL